MLASRLPFGQDRPVEKYFHKLHENRSPPGLERVIWRRLPLALLASVVLPGALSVIARLLPHQGSAFQVAKSINTVDIFAFATAVTAMVAVVTVAIGCIVVMIMKGPAYVADGYDRLHSPESID
jgi:hypothetical protein